MLRHKLNDTRGHICRRGQSALGSSSSSSYFHTSCLHSAHILRIMGSSKSNALCAFPFPPNGNVGLGSGSAFFGSSFSFSVGIFQFTSRPQHSLPSALMLSTLLLRTLSPSLPGLLLLRLYFGFLLPLCFPVFSLECFALLLLPVPCPLTLIMTVASAPPTPYAAP